MHVRVFEEQAKESQARVRAGTYAITVGVLLDQFRSERGGRLHDRTRGAESESTGTMLEQRIPYKMTIIKTDWMGENIGQDKLLRSERSAFGTGSIDTLVKAWNDKALGSILT